MSNLGKMILAMCDETHTEHMVINTLHVATIASQCGCFMREVVEYATSLGVWVVA